MTSAQNIIENIIADQISIERIFIPTCVMTDDRMLSKTQPYLLVIDDDHGLKMVLMKWVDSYTKNGVLHLLCEDLKSLRLFWLQYDASNNSPCHWMVFDDIHIKQFIQMLKERQVIIDFCGCESSASINNYS